MDQLGDRAIIEKARALDGYLDQEVGKKWCAIKAHLPLLPHEAASSKELCQFFLAAVSAAKIIQNPSSRDPLLLDDLNQPFKTLGKYSSPKNLISLDHLSGHPALTRDLSSAWHPTWQDSNLAVANCMGEEEEAQFTRALEIIEDASVESAKMTSEICSSFCLLHPGSTIGKGSSISLTSKIVPGLIYFTPAPVITTAESIVHEVAHLWLSRHEAGDDLYLDPNRTVTTPLRSDPRPLSGLMHQVWVLSNLVPFYKDLSNLALPVIQSNADKIAKRMTHHAADLESGLRTLNKNLDGLTGRGKEFIGFINAASH